MDGAGVEARTALTRYEWLLRLSDDGRRRLMAALTPVRVPPSVLLQEGDACSAVTLISAGLVRVSKRRLSGRSISLYTVGPGELCVLEALAVITASPFRAEAVAESAVTGFSLPSEVLRGLLHTESGVREALFQAFERRLAAALELIGDVALETLDARLAASLLRHASGAAEVHLTHDQLARELACAREAVSRTLEHWERAHLVELGRGHIRLSSPERLAILAGRRG